MVETTPSSDSSDFYVEVLHQLASNVVNKELGGIVQANTLNISEEHMEFLRGEIIELISRHCEHDTTTNTVIETRVQCSHKTKERITFELGKYCFLLVFVLIIY